jgi:hypothetical protein
LATEPRYADALPNEKSFDSLADRVHPANDLVPGHDRQRSPNVSVDHMRVGSADAASRHLYAQLAAVGLRQRPLNRPQGEPGASSCIAIII